MESQRLPYDFIRFDYKERLTDRYLATHLHRFEVFSKPVALAVLVEINSPWHPSSEFGQKIINSLIKEFTQNEAQSFLSRFELALKKTNRIIQVATESINTPISVVALLLEEDQVHASGVGLIKLGLVRNNKLASVINGKNESANAFNAVTSGDMTENDWIILANQSFYKIIQSLDYSIFSHGQTEEITQLILGSKPSKNESAAGLMFKYSPESIAQAQTIFWDSSQQFSPKPSIKISLPKFTGLRMPELKLPDKFLPALKALRSSAVNSITTIASRIRSKPTKTKVATEKTTPSLPKVNLIKRWPIAVFLLLLILSINYLYRNVQVNRSSDVIEITFASKIIDDTSTDRFSVLKNTFNVNEYTALNDEQKILLSDNLKLSKIYLLDLPSPTTQTANPVVSLDTADQTFSIIDSSGQTWLFRDSLLVQLNQVQPIPQPKTLTFFNPDKLVITDEAGNVWLINSTPEQPVALAVPKSLSTLPKISARYNENLYFVTTTNKAAYRAPNFSNNLDSVASYLDEGQIELRDIVDLAINGNLIVVSSTGQAVDFTRNQLGSLKIQAPLVESNVKIAANDSEPIVVMSTGRFLYIFSNTGELLRTLFLTSDKSITDITFDSTDSSLLWVAIEKEIYKIPTAL